MEGTLSIREHGLSVDGGNYTSHGSGRITKVSFFSTETPLLVFPIYSHIRAAGKISQGHRDKANLLKDQIVPADQKKPRQENQSEIESRVERCDGKPACGCEDNNSR